MDANGYLRVGQSSDGLCGATRDRVEVVPRTVRIQVRIDEATGDIKVHCEDMNPGHASWQFGATS